MVDATMLVGFGREPLRPPLPFDPQGSAARTRAVQEIDPDLSVTACVIRTERATIAIISADVLGHTRGFATAARRAVGAAVGCPPEHVLISATHTHASLWPGARDKVSGEVLDRWLPGERRYVADLPRLYASAARRAAEAATAARVSWSVGRVPDRAVNRREPTPDGGTIIGWDRDAPVDDSVTVLRFVAASGRTIGTIVGFACHPVVLGHLVERASSDYVGPLRNTVESLQGGLCLFLQGASGDVQPREALHSARGPEVDLGRRIGVEAVHAIADADPWPRDIVSVPLGRWTPTRLYRSVLAEEAPRQIVSVRSRTIRVALQPPPDPADLRAELTRLNQERAAVDATGGESTNGLDIQIRWASRLLDTVAVGRVPRSAPVRVWVARIGVGVIAGVSAELFGSIGAAIRHASSAEYTLVAGCCDGVLGYVPSAAAFPLGGFEVTSSHRVYGQPSAVAADTGARIARAAVASMQEMAGELGFEPRIF